MRSGQRAPGSPQPRGADIRVHERRLWWATGTGDGVTTGASGSNLDDGFVIGSSGDADGAAAVEGVASGGRDGDDAAPSDGVADGIVGPPDGVDAVVDVQAPATTSASARTNQLRGRIVNPSMCGTARRRGDGRVRYDPQRHRRAFDRPRGRGSQSRSDQTEVSGLYVAFARLGVASPGASGGRMTARPAICDWESLGESGVIGSQIAPVASPASRSQHPELTARQHRLANRGRGVVDARIS